MNLFVCSPHNSQAVGRVVRRADGYFCQFGVKAARRVEHTPTGKQVGIDVGLKAYYTDSDSNTIENPRYFRKAEKKLKRLHRQLSRKQKKSSNRKKARKQLARAYLKVHKKSLSVRTHVCPSCSLVLDRDHNAAVNILQAGLFILLLQTFTGSVGQTETSENASGQSASTRPSRRRKTGKRSG